LFAPIGKQKEDTMAEESRETFRQEVFDHAAETERNESGLCEAQSFAERFDPFHER
jgi:hypothetical protein